MVNTPMEAEFPTLDAHAHIAVGRSEDDLLETGHVLAMTLSLDEAELACSHSGGSITWGVGCHPRQLRAQQGFKREVIQHMLELSPIAGEVGLDGGSHVPMDQQLWVFRQVLEIVSGLPRLVSIHSYRATELVLEELRRTPINTPILHWWTGNARETSEAVEIGCYFSIQAAVARQSKFHTRVPLERVLLESDHGYNDPPAAIPCRIEWVEYLVAQQYKIDVQELRRIAWSNLAAIARRTGTLELFAKSTREILHRQPVEPSLQLFKTIP